MHWFEELDKEEKKKEQEKLEHYKKMINITEEHSIDSDSVTSDDIDTMLTFEAEKKDYLSVKLYIQMEFCAGNDLSVMIEKREGKSNRKENYQIMCQIVKGMKSLHDKEVIHRDLKPMNIFL